jgi:hypothetical protein
LAHAQTWVIFAVLAGGGMLSALVLLAVEPLVRKMLAENSAPP